MNVELLEKVKQLILEEPRRFNMGRWVSKGHLVREQKPPCGTVACIAGWAIIERDRKRRIKGSKNVTQDYSDVRDFGTEAGAEALGLTREQAFGLFHIDYWPDRFRKAYEAGTPGGHKRARAAAARIDHFIKTGGAE